MAQTLIMTPARRIDAIARAMQDHDLDVATTHLGRLFDESPLIEDWAGLVGMDHREWLLALDAQGLWGPVGALGDRLFMMQPDLTITDLPIGYAYDMPQPPSLIAVMRRNYASVDRWPIVRIMQETEGCPCTTDVGYAMTLVMDAYCLTRGKCAPFGEWLPGALRSQDHFRHPRIADVWRMLNMAQRSSDVDIRPIEALGVLRGCPIDDRLDDVDDVRFPDGTCAWLGRTHDDVRRLAWQRPGRPVREIEGHDDFVAAIMLTGAWDTADWLYADADTVEEVTNYLGGYLHWSIDRLDPGGPGLLADLSDDGEAIESAHAYVCQGIGAS